MRLISLMFMLLAPGCVLASCGGSSNPAAAGVRRTAATTPATATLSDGGSPLTVVQARGFARAVNLTSLDVPGFHISKPEPEHESATEKRLEHEMLHCVHPVATKNLLEAKSKDFEHESSTGAQSVQSEVTVARTLTVAAKELALIRSGRARACVSHYLDLLLKGKKYRGATFGPVSIAQGTPPAPGSTGSFAWRISVPISLHGVRLPLYIYILGFVYGPSEIALFTEGFPAPFPAAGVEHLFSLLLKRAEAHKI